MGFPWRLVLRPLRHSFEVGLSLGRDNPVLPSFFVKKFARFRVRFSLFLFGLGKQKTHADGRRGQLQEEADTAEGITSSMILN